MVAEIPLVGGEVRNEVEMKTKSQDRLLKIIPGLVSICWVIGIIVCILWVVSAVVLVILGGDHFRMLTTNILETLFKGPYLSVSFTDPISFTGSPNIFILYCLEKVVVVFSFMFVIFNLRKILKKLVDRAFFIAESIRRVKIIGYTIVAGALASGFMASIFSLLMARDIEIPGVNVTFYYGINLPMVFLGALILVIAQVFRKGFEMQEEQKLTV